MASDKMIEQLTLDFGLAPYTFKRKIRLIELFAGIGMVASGNLKGITVMVVAFIVMVIIRIIRFLWRD